MNSSAFNRESDVIQNWAKLLVLYGIPIAAIGLSAFLDSIPGEAVVFVMSFTAMGGFCLRNTHQCGRVHCAFTGPWFMLAGLVSAFHGLGIVNFGEYGWVLIGNVGIWGAAILWLATESILGKYFHRE